MKVSFSHHRFQSKKLETFFCGVALLAAASGAHGAILIDDNFTNSSGASANMENTQAPGVGIYERIQGSSGNLTVTTISGFGSGNVLQIGNNANTYFRAFNDSSATLQLSDLTSGQSLSMSFDFRTTDDTSAQNFGFGFLNATNSIAYVNLDARATETASEFRFRTGSPNMSTNGTSIGGSWNDAISTETNNNLKFTITRTGTGYLLQYFLNGAEISSIANGLASTENLDITGIGFRWGEAPATTTNIDNVVVEFIPEPSSLLLLGGSLSCGLLLRRRQR